MRNQYGAQLRQLATREFGVETIVEMHDVSAFHAEVSAYPAVTVIRHGAQGPAVVARASPALEHAGSVRIARMLSSVRAGGRAKDTFPGMEATRVETWFEGDAPWPCIAPEKLALLKRLEREFAPLQDSDTGTHVGIGVATGLDEAFITTDPALVEASRLLPLAMAADTRSGTLAWSGHYLIDPWTPEGLADLRDYPRLRAHFARFDARLHARNIGQRQPQQWYRTIDRVHHDLTGQRKLYIPDIKDRINPVLDAGGTYPHHNLYVVQSDVWDMEVLGGLLLSEVAQFFVACYGVRMRGGYLRFQAQYLRRIRVPHPAAISAERAQRLAAAFRRRDVAQATEVACALYGIAPHTGAFHGY